MRAAVVFLLITFETRALDLQELRRTEDWEMHLTNAAQLAHAQKFDEAQSLYTLLTQAAQEFDFPLLLKAKVRNNHGAMLNATGRFAEAEKAFLDASDYWAKSAGPNSPQRASSFNNLGEVYRQMGRYADAEKAYNDSLAIRAAASKDSEIGRAHV